MNYASLELCEELYELIGYLIRKLLRDIPRDESDYFHAYFYLSPTVADMWHAGYRIGAASPIYECTEDIPEDAACKLCIMLFKQGILRKEQE